MFPPGSSMAHYGGWRIWAVVLWAAVGLATASATAAVPTDVPREELSVTQARAVLLRLSPQLVVAQRYHDTLQLRQLHWRVGQANYTLHRYDAALRHYRQAARLSSSRSAEWAWSGWLLGRTLFSQGDTGKSRQTYAKAFATFRRLRNLTGQGQVLEQMGELYGQTGHWPQAQTSYEQALSTWQLMNDQPHVAQALNRLGTAHREQKHYSRALYYLRQSLKMARRHQDSTQISQALNGMGRVYQTLNNQEVAYSFFTQALQTLPATARPRTRAIILRNLGVTSDSLGNHGAAAQYLRLALGPARQTGSKVLVSEVYGALVALYRRQGQPQAALEALAHYTELQDSVFAEQRSAQVAELQTRYETEKKEKEIQLLLKDRQLQQANLHRQTLLRNLLAVGSLLLLLTVAVMYRAHRRQQVSNRLLQRKNAAIHRQKEELDRLNHTKDTLFSIISHDLRGPLSSLYSLLALMKLGRLPAERLASHSERLTRMLDGTLHLLDNLLNWSAAQLKGEGSARAERIRLDELADETVALFQGDAERKNIRLQNDMPEVCLARADVNMTRLILRNLLSNALKFTGSGGTVMLAARRQGQWWEITVQDTGVGIEPAQQNRLLGNGAHFTTPGTAREKGTGLGLRLCQEFVLRNGGKLTFQSQPGVGSVFQFTLPAFDEGSFTQAMPPAVANAAAE
ncbi:ATP-binding protein [Hymenobacter perfusus]|nr:tetratricopeptide repeat protein [Hymenobacter perfusus]